MRDRSYHVNITLGDNYTVEDSFCDCVNGLDKCHHKASVLLFGFKNVSKTDIKASWIQRPKSAPPTQTLTMDELFPTPPKLANYSQYIMYRCIQVLHRCLLFLTILVVIQILKWTIYYVHVLVHVHNRIHVTGRQKDLCISMHWMLSPEPTVPQLDVPCVEDLLLSDSYLESTNKIQWLKDKMAMTPDQIQQVAQLTAGQSNNHLWALVRKNRLTASNFSSALAALRRNRFPPSLFKKIMCSYNLSNKDAIIWGTNNEAVARAKYCSFGDAVVEETGVWLHTSGVLGASPDGIIHRPATHNYTHQLPTLGEQLEAMRLRPEILEIKCPFTSRNMTIEEAINTSKDFCLGS
ncbi:hypothetical protein WMY93_003203 [Mugilogobius chulae]|uniref:YqaJ viral recombinase domain-containing protein n=1 Tax=Mugilogobius chulae TaxID=88201 RepID=A0AAW0Q5S6_9GOBI